MKAAPSGRRGVLGEGSISRHRAPPPVAGWGAGHLFGEVEWSRMGEAPEATTVEEVRSSLPRSEAG